MRKLLRTALALIGLVAIVTFAVGNRHTVDLSFWPLPYGWTLPVYGLLLAGIAIGALLGWAATWLAARPRRVAYRELRARTDVLEQQERQRRTAEEQAAAGRAMARVPSPAH
jgi:hypothetical protein